jgi:hypothetical protein
MSLVHNNEELSRQLFTGNAGASATDKLHFLKQMTLHTKIEIVLSKERLDMEDPSY